MGEGRYCGQNTPSRNTGQPPLAPTRTESGELCSGGFPHDQAGAMMVVIKCFILARCEMAISGVAGRPATTAIVPASGPSDSGAGYFGSFVDALTAQMSSAAPQPVPDFNWMSYMRARYNNEDAINKKRLDEIRKRDPAMADRLAAILKLPMSEQQAAIADIEMTLAKRAAETHPDDEALAAEYGNKARVGAGANSNSAFDAPTVARWI